MPSTEQAIVNLRTLLASDFLNSDTPGLSISGRQLLKYSRAFLTEIIELLRNKNDLDQIQDFVWYLLRARVSVDATDLIQTATSTRAKADASAALESIKTVGSLLLTNSDFRRFLGDLNTIGKQVFSDTAHTLSNVAEDASKQLEPSSTKIQTAKDPKVNGEPVSTDDLQSEAAQIGEIVKEGLQKTSEDARHSLVEHVAEDKDSLLLRLKSAVTRLRKRTDYTDSVTTIASLIERYARVYSRAVDETISTVQADVQPNPALNRAIRNGWLLVSSFGDKEAWKELEACTNRVVSHAEKDPEFEKTMTEVALSIQKLFSDPSVYESSSGVEELGEKSVDTTNHSPLKTDVDSMMRQARIVFVSVMNDKDVASLLKTCLKLWSIISPPQATINPDLFTDVYNFFLPMFIKTIQYIPIPRLELSTPEVDLLVENLILEPGRTINNTSFLPFQMVISTVNDLSIRAARFETLTTVSSLLRVTIKGLSLRADDLGFWLRTRGGFFNMTDAGIASFELDDRGIDISLDVEIGRDAQGLESLLSLRKVHVHVHHLSYSLSQSKLACFAWFFKPILRPIIRKTVEWQIAHGIKDLFHVVNRELVFARERLRATRIADPKDLLAFIKAVAARLTPRDEPDVYVNVGIVGGANKPASPFAGRYTPGSLVKLWEEEAQRAMEHVDDEAELGGGWRNAIFDVKTISI